MSTSKLTSALVLSPPVCGGHDWQRVRQQWPYVGVFLPMVFTFLGCRKSGSVEKKGDAAALDRHGSFPKVSVFFARGTGRGGYNNLPPNPLPLANATLSCPSPAKAEKYAICPHTKVNHFSDANLVRDCCLS